MTLYDHAVLENAFEDEVLERLQYIHREFVKQQKGQMALTTLADSIIKKALFDAMIDAVYLMPNFPAKRRNTLRKL